MESDDMLSSDEDMEELEKLILEKLLKIKKYKVKKEKNENMVVFLNKFLAKDMQTRYKTISDKHVNDFLYLNNAILCKKIDIDLKDFELELLHYVQHDVHPKDRKLIFAEDYNVHIIYKKALRILGKELKENRK